MGFFSKLFGKSDKDISEEVSKDVEQLAELLKDNSNELYGLPEGYKPEDASNVSEETKARLPRLLEALDAVAPPRPRVKLTPVRASTNVFDNKLGGTPYLPKGFEYPTVREGEHMGKPLRMLAQINFAKLPPMEGFPEKGILQFYAGCDGDELIGMDFNDGFNQNTFRVIFHSEIIEDVTKIYSAKDMPSFDDDELMFPYKGRYLLKVAEEAEAHPISASDYHFQRAVLEAYNKTFGTTYDSVFGMAETNSIYQHDKELCDLLYETRQLSGSGVGGYPYFTQSDPREYDDKAAKCNILLFQLDSEGGGDDMIMWGDSGVGNFFIREEDLAARDFSNVLYNWDCC